MSTSHAEALQPESLRSVPTVSPFNEHFRRFAEAMPHVVWTAEADGSASYFNGRWIEVTGLSADESQGEGWTHALHPEDRDEVLRLWRGAVSSSQTLKVETRLCNRAGECRWFLLRANPYREDGQPLRWFGGFTDIQEQKIAQQQLATLAIENARLYQQAQEEIEARAAALADLAESNRRLELARETASMGIWEWNIQTREVNWSPEMYQFHGLAPGALQVDPRAWLRTVHAEDRIRVQRAFQQAVAQREGYDLEFRVVLPDGQLRWLASRAQVFSDEAGQPRRMLGVAMDISGRKRTEEALRVSEKLVATGRLAATIAHEINNPLEAVTNLLYLLEHDPNLDSRAREYINMVQREILRVAHITKQTLGFYREQSAPGEVTPAQLVDEVLGLYSSKREAKRLHVERRFSYEGTMRGFAGELRQVISNIVVNAVEASPPGAMLHVRVHRARDWGRDGQPGVRIVIADHGPGIARDTQQHIFEPFFTTKGERGTGLGLWVSHGIVQKHGGRIRLRSRVQPGHSGTVFSIFLPLEAGSAEAAPESASLQRAS